MTPTELQPIEWNAEDETCCGPSNWRHVLFPDDIVFAQFLASESDFGDEEITNPNLEPPQSEYVTVQPFVVNLFTSGLLLSNGAEVEQTVTLTNGEWYAITVGIEYPYQGGQSDPSTLIISGFQESVIFSANNGEQTLYGIWAGGTEISFRRNDLSQFTESSPQIRVYLLSVKRVFAPTIVTVSESGESSTDITLDFDLPYINIEVNTSALAVNESCFQIKATDNSAQVFLSNMFHFQAVDNCHIRIAGCGNNNFFGGSFTPNLRIDGKIIDDGPVYDRNIYQNSRGRHRLNYGRAYQAFLLMVERSPEYIRRYLYLLPMFETIAIQVGQQTPKAYFAVEEVEKDGFADSDELLASVRCRIAFKTQNIESIFDGSCDVILPPLVLGERKNDIVIGDTTTVPETAISAQ